MCVIFADSVKSGITAAGKVLNSDTAKSAAELFNKMLHPNHENVKNSAAQSAAQNKNTTQPAL